MLMCYSKAYYIVITLNIVITGCPKTISDNLGDCFYLVKTDFGDQLSVYLCFIINNYLSNKLLT